jgi:hypothetical protein
MIEKRDTNDDAKQWNDHVDAAHGYWCCIDILLFFLALSGMANGCHNTTKVRLDILSFKHRKFETK